MTKIFTPNDVIRYVYNDVNKTEKKEIKTAIISDNTLSDIYFETMAMKKSLNRLVRQPTEKAISNILNFSKTFSLHSVG